MGVSMFIPLLLVVAQHTVLAYVPDPESLVSLAVEAAELMRAVL